MLEGQLNLDPDEFCQRDWVVNFDRLMKGNFVISEGQSIGGSRLKETLSLKTIYRMLKKGKYLDHDIRASLPVFPKNKKSNLFQSKNPHQEQFSFELPQVKSETRIWKNQEGPLARNVHNRRTQPILIEQDASNNNVVFNYRSKELKAALNLIKFNNKPINTKYGRRHFSFGAIYFYSLAANFDLLKAADYVHGPREKDVNTRNTLWSLTFRIRLIINMLNDIFYEKYEALFPISEKSLVNKFENSDKNGHPFLTYFARKNSSDVSYQHLGEKSLIATIGKDFNPFNGSYGLFPSMADSVFFACNDIHPCKIPPATQFQK